MWFRLFDGSFPPSLPEDRRFNALLNHLPSEALPFVDHVLRDPGLDPFTRAKDCLVRHYEVSPRDLARNLRALSSLGDKTPSEMLFYMRSLLPGHPDNPLFEVIFIDLLPANARDAAVKFGTLEEMAKAADQILAEQPAPSAAIPLTSASVQALYCDRDDQEVNALRFPPSGARRLPPPNPKDKDGSLCFIHERYGREAFKCASPVTCRMRGITRPRPAGNENAGQ